MCRCITRLRKNNFTGEFSFYAEKGVLTNSTSRLGYPAYIRQAYGRNHRKQSKAGLLLRPVPLRSIDHVLVKFNQNMPVLQWDFNHQALRGGSGQDNPLISLERAEFNSDFRLAVHYARHSDQSEGSDAAKGMARRDRIDLRNVPGR